MNKYIVRNCPCYAKGIFCKGGDIIDDGCADYTLDKDSLICCADRTDCVLKRIVNKCKEQQNNFNNLPDNIAFDIKAIFGNLSEEILELLEIEENS